MRLLFLLPSLFFVLQAAASEDTLHWSKGRLLTWSDFHASPIEGLAVSGEVFCMNTAAFNKANIFSKADFVVTTVFQMDRAWTIVEARTPEMLAYYQVLFDLHARHAQRLREALKPLRKQVDPTVPFQAAHQASLNDLGADLDRFRRESRAGLDPDVVRAWAKELSAELRTDH